LIDITSRQGEEEERGGPTIDTNKTDFSPGLVLHVSYRQRLVKA